MKPIPNYPNYSVTEDGKIINNKTNRELKPILGNVGYYQVSLCNSGKIKNVSIHRLVASAFLSNDENKREVNHINGIKTDNRIENLELWDTSQPSGQRVEDKIKYYSDLIKKYKDHPQYKHIVDNIICGGDLNI